MKIYFFKTTGNKSFIGNLSLQQVTFDYSDLPDP